MVEYENVHFLGGLWTKTPYKGTPTKELDEEWDRLTATFLIDIPPSALEQLNKTSAAVALPPDTPHGLGGRYIGAVEVFHQLHCLNLIRKMTYESYYKETDDSWKDGPAMLRMHVDHCIDILRQKLTCDGDVCMFCSIVESEHANCVLQQ